MGVRAGKLLVSRACTSAEEVLAAFASATCAPENSLRCLNPECGNYCTWKRSGGRPALFCRRACREKFEDTRAVLLVEVQHLETALTEQLTHRTRRKLDGLLAMRRWCLSHYPNLDQTDHATG